jgi:hypothetical protein
LVKDCDHFYNGKDAVICDLVSSWLKKATGEIQKAKNKD